MIVYGWKDAADHLAMNVNQVGHAYTFFNLKVMANVGRDFDSSKKDRGGDFPYKLLFEKASRVRFGMDGGRKRAGKGREGWRG